MIIIVYIHPPFTHGKWTGNFVRSGAYSDTPQPIGHGQTISAPHMHAHVLEMLADQATVWK
jgi:protein-L-isoaspartate O-methyltransferase